MKKIPMFIVMVVTLAAAIPAYANIAVEFGRGSEKISMLDITESTTNATERERVVIEFFKDDGRTLLDLSDPDADPSDFRCYEAELRDLKTRRIVGYGIDCLGIRPVISAPLMGDLGDEHETPGLGQALSPQIDAVTFLFFKGGHIVVDGFTTVRPFFDGVGNGDAYGPLGDMTHITGSIPNEESNIVDASRRFKKLVGEGHVRLSGAVNTDGFFTLDLFPIAFSCIFVISY